MPGSIVWLASYMKSGNTWLRLLLANLLSNSLEPVDINDFSLSPWSATWRDTIEDLTLVDSSLLSRSEIDALWPYTVRAIAAEAEGLTFMKLHEAYRRDAGGRPLLGDGHGRAAIYVLRDPRDVAVSMSHHNGSTLDKAISTMNSCESPADWKAWKGTKQIPQVQLDWSGNVESWVDQRDMPVHVIRYEDMRVDTAAVLHGIVEFLDLDVADDRVEHAVSCSEFRKLQQLESEAGFRERPALGGRSAAPFFRSGRAGAWREVMTAEQETTIINAHRRVMERFGYL